jgi:hypothetical protein
MFRLIGRHQARSQPKSPTPKSASALWWPCQRESLWLRRKAAHCPTEEPPKPAWIEERSHFLKLLVLWRLIYILLCYLYVLRDVQEGSQCQFRICEYNSNGCRVKAMNLSNGVNAHCLWDEMKRKEKREGEDRDRTGNVYQVDCKVFWRWYIVQCVHKVYSGFWKIVARKENELVTCGLRQVTAKLWKFFTDLSRPRCRLRW